MAASGVIYSWQELALSSCGPAPRLYVIDVPAELGIPPNRDRSKRNVWARGLWLNRSNRDRRFTAGRDLCVKLLHELRDGSHRFI